MRRFKWQTLKHYERTLDQFPANTIQYTVCTGYAEDAYYMLWDKYSQTHVPNTTKRPLEYVNTTQFNFGSQSGDTRETVICVATYFDPDTNGQFGFLYSGSDAFCDFDVAKTKLLEHFKDKRPYIG